MARDRLLIVLAASLVLGCGTGTRSTTPAQPSVTAGPTPTVASSRPPYTLVRWVAAPGCSITLVSDVANGPAEVMVEHFRCPGLVMTDPRLSGTRGLARTRASSTTS
jgi:hypothetical protein